MMNHQAKAGCITAMLVGVTMAAPALADGAVKDGEVGDEGAQSPSAEAPIKATDTIRDGVIITSTSHLTVSGAVLSVAVNHVFQIRNNRGRVFPIDVGGVVPSYIDEAPIGYRVNVYGIYKNGTLKATNIGVDEGFADSHGIWIEPEEAALTGVVAADANAYGFDLRDRAGIIHSVLTRQVAKARSAKTLRTGDTVRVYGDSSVVDNVPQLDATNLAILRRSQ